MAAGDTFLVEAVISKWIDGKYGPYGFAEINSPDSPAEKALCSYKVKGLTPPLGEKFLCHIVLEFLVRPHGVFIGGCLIAPLAAVEVLEKVNLRCAQAAMAFT